MAALLTDTIDSDSEFGYDFSPEDEEALIQLASADPTPATRHQPAATSVIDAVPGKTESVAGDDVAILNDVRTHAPGTHAHRGLISTAGDPARARRGQAAQAQTLPSPVSLNQDVAYPDCMSSTASQPLFLKLTDLEASSEPSAVQSRT